MDGQIDRRTDTPSFGDTRSHLKVAPLLFLFAFPFSFAFSFLLFLLLWRFGPSEAAMTQEVDDVVGVDANGRQRVGVA